MKNKTLVVLLVILAVVAVGYLVLSEGQKVKEPVKSQNQTQDQSKNQSPAQPEKPKVNVQGVPKTELPKDFPSDIPLEVGAEVTLNFNGTNAKGELQASREFISKKTVAENYALYQKALKENGWNITNTIADAPAGSLIFAVKDNSDLNIRIYIDAANKVRVSINNVVSK